MPLLTLDNISLRFADKVILEQANASIYKGSKIALIGRNGQGKSTLMKLIAGQISPDDGEIRIRNGVTISRLEQNPPTDDDRLVFNVIAAGFGDKGKLLINYQEALNHQKSDLASDLQQKIDAENAWDLLPKINAYIDQFGLEADKKLSQLSGGWRRRVLLVASIISQPSILLLDEPTNHMDITTVLQLEKLLQNYNGTLILISHDRSFIKNIANKIFDLDRGMLSVFDCNYQTYLKRKDGVLNAENLANSRFKKKLSQEEVWIRQGIKARRTRNEGRVRALEIMRQTQLKKNQRVGKVRLHNPADEKHMSKMVFEVKKLAFQINNNLLIDNFSTIISKGDKIGIIGGNGVGKSSLIKLLLGQHKPTSGHIRRAKTIDLAYFDQLREELNPKLRAMDFVSNGKEMIQIGKKEMHIIGYLKNFLFTAEQARAPIMMCSGGEKNRLMLAKVLSQKANLLVLDEPSNDLDVETLELLEETLSQYQGTLILISHDRAFMNNIVTRSFVFEGNGNIGQYVGGYDDYLTQKNNKKLTEKTAPKIKKSTHIKPAKKNGYKEQQILKKLPNRIEKIEIKISELQDIVAQENFFQTYDNAQNILRELQQLEEKQTLLYEQWSELE